MCTCPTPHDLFDSIDCAIDDGRWSITGVGAGPPGQLKWLYTVGLAERFSHPELLVVGVCCAPCGAGILNRLGERVAAGERFAMPSQIPIDLDGGLVHVRHVPPACWDSDWFAVWKSYYATKAYDAPTAEAMQVVFSDRRGRFPWEPGADAGLAAAQQMPDAPPAPRLSRAARRAKRHHR